MEKLAVKNNNKILMGLSGGVDSTAAVLMLQKKGYDVMGLFFDVLGIDNINALKAESVAKELGIDFIYKDASKEFKEKVITNFCWEYLRGRTPNPCVLCNPSIKFQILKDEADKKGAAFIATGHYANVRFSDKLNRYAIFKGDNIKKDQSYMLYGLGQDLLKRTIFPLGEVGDKNQTRGLVRESGIQNADAKDSQEICFLQNGDQIGSYIKRAGYASKPGNFVDMEGHILGHHNGFINFTVGQRKGLGMTFGKPAYVIELREQDNAIVLGNDEDLFTRTVYAKCDSQNLAIANLEMMTEGIPVMAKIRYAASASEAIIYRDFNPDSAGKEILASDSDDTSQIQIKAVFNEAQRAATPGQSLVFYQGDMLIGGGIITSNTKE